MTTTELNTQKVNLMRDILEENDENFILELVAYFYRVKNDSYPCCYTDDEKRNRIDQSVKDAKAGLGISNKEMYSKHPEWL